MTLFFENP